MKHSWLKFIGFSAAVFLLFFALDYFGFKYLHPLYYTILIFFFFIGSILNLLSNFVLDKSQTLFQTGIFGGMGLKLFASFAFLLGFFFYDIENKPLFTVNFIIAYFFFTLFEVYSIITNLRAQKKLGKTANK